MPSPSEVWICRSALPMRASLPSPGCFAASGASEAGSGSRVPLWLFVINLGVTPGLSHVETELAAIRPRRMAGCRLGTDLAIIRYRRGGGKEELDIRNIAQPRARKVR